MYLHLGQNTIVREEEILGIFDLDITSQSPRTREYLAAAQQRGEVTAVTDDLPKSFVVTGVRGEQKVMLCQLSCATLLKRSEQNEFSEYDVSARK